MKADWLLYAAAIAVLVIVPGAWHENSALPEAPPPPGVGEMSLFATFTPFSAGSIINLPTDDQRMMTGTAFAIAASGEWIMARESVASCPHPFLNIGGNLGVPFTVRTVTGVDGYVIGVTQGAGRALSLTDPATIEPGVRGFMPGYPADVPGEATGRYIGTLTMERAKRGDHPETVMAWAQAGRTRGIRGDLNKLVGAPVLDDNTRVIGITIEEKPRRGRIYSSTPETLAKLASAAAVKPDFDSEAVITKANYGIVSDTLRREYRVAQVGCIQS
jgi:serine protease Do